MSIRECDELKTCSKLSENSYIIRAFYEPYWDEEKCRGSASLFEGNFISVDRATFFGCTKTMQIFFDNFNNETRSVKGLGVLLVKDLTVIGNELCDSGSNTNKNATKARIMLHYAPNDKNLNHFELVACDCDKKAMAKISKAMAKKILNKTIHVPIKNYTTQKPCFEIWKLLAKKLIHKLAPTVRS